MPIALCVIAWFPEELVGWGVLGGALISLGLSALLTELARDPGKGKQDFLFEKWGGLPTTVMLRHRHSSLNLITLGRYHAVLGQLLHMNLPTAQEEAKAPDEADRIYESCVDFLRERTRDRKRFPLVFAELASYGFRRNLWGMKSGGMLIAIIGTACSAAAFTFAVIEGGTVKPAAIVALAVNATLATWWMLRIGPSWVRVAADAYARQLLGSCETLNKADVSFSQDKPAVLPRPTKSAHPSRFGRRSD